VQGVARVNVQWAHWLNQQCRWLHKATGQLLGIVSDPHVHASISGNWTWRSSDQQVPERPEDWKCQGTEDEENSRLPPPLPRKKQENGKNYQDFVLHKKRGTPAPTTEIDAHGEGREGPLDQISDIDRVRNSESHTS